MMRAAERPAGVPRIDLRPAAREALANVQLQQFVRRATQHKDAGRQTALAEAFGARCAELRTLAGKIRQHALDHLDFFVEQFAANATASGAQVHFAADAEQANAICVALGRACGARLCVKSKSMVTEETRLVPALQAAGVETIETDLGEFILQLDGDAPSHIVAPLIHKDRTSVGRTFAQRLDVPYTDDPAALTRIARDYLRDKYRRADLGVSGANFLVAETGALVLCTNEGNAALATGAPPVHIAVVGVEKIVPRMADLALLLKLLARSATAQPLTVYTTIINGPRRPHEPDGPAELHIVLLDNGRCDLLRPAARELLRCIRCGACLNTCPVYRKLGGHSYGSVYSGPIGAVLTPELRGLRPYRDLPHASSLCGACRDACPVAIDLPGHLTRLRADLAAIRAAPDAAERAFLKLWSAIALRPALYEFALAAARWVLPAAARLRVLRGLPGPLRGWIEQREPPMPAEESFRAWWRRRTAGEPESRA
jgi:L-lactate dehydrogenase complex protein LldF